MKFGVNDRDRDRILPRDIEGYHNIHGLGILFHKPVMWLMSAPVTALWIRILSPETDWYMATKMVPPPNQSKGLLLYSGLDMGQYLRPEGFSWDVQHPIDWGDQVWPDFDGVRRLFWNSCGSVWNSWDPFIFDGWYFFLFPIEIGINGRNPRPLTI